MDVGEATNTGRYKRFTTSLDIAILVILFFFLILKVKETHKHSSMKNKLPTKEQKSKLSVELFFCSTKCRKTTAQYLINLGEKEHNPVISYHA